LEAFHIKINTIVNKVNTYLADGWNFKNHMLRAPLHYSGVSVVRPQIEITKGYLLYTIALED